LQEGGENTWNVPDRDYPVNEDDQEDFERRKREERARKRQEKAPNFQDSSPPDYLRQENQAPDSFHFE